MPQDKSLEGADSDTDSLESFTESEYDKAMGEAGQERDYEGFKQYLRERKKYRKMYE